MGTTLRKKMLMNRLSISIIRSSKRILKSNFVQPKNSNSVSLTTNFIGYHATTGRRFTCQQFSTSTTTPNDSEEQLALDKKRILWASIKRGMRENELILGRFARANLKSMSRKELDQFAHILQQHDQFLNNWLLKKEPIPDELNTEMWKRIVAFIEAGPDNLEL